MKRMLKVVFLWWCRWQEPCAMLYPRRSARHLPRCLSWRVYCDHRQHQNPLFMFSLYRRNTCLHSGGHRWDL